MTTAKHLLAITAGVLAALAVPVLLALTYWSPATLARIGGYAVEGAIAITVLVLGMHFMFDWVYTAVRRFFE